MVPRLPITRSSIVGFQYLLPVYRDGISKLKLCRGQVEQALTLTAKFTAFAFKQPGSSLTLFTIIGLDTVNVVLVRRKRKQGGYEVLSEMPSAMTIDGCRGQENDIAMIVIGTTHQSDPGFTCQANWLNVALTRARSGLVNVGDVKVVEEKAKEKRKKTADYGPNGETQ